MRALLWLVVPALLAACATTAPGEQVVSTDLTLYVADSLKPTLQQHARPDSGPKAWTTVQVAEPVSFAATRGGSIDQMQATVGNDGLLSIEVLARSLPDATDRFIAQGRTSSLCGLINVLTDSRSGLTAQLTTAVGSIPVPITSESRRAARTRLTALSTTAPVLCAPQAGTRFTVHLEFERWRHLVNNVHDLRRQMSVIEDMTCDVASTAQRASDLHPAWSGQSLQVDCEHKVAGQAPRRTRWAYLPDAKRYLPVEERTEHHIIRIQYQETSGPR